jgi:hypothetical protein
MTTKQTVLQRVQQAPLTDAQALVELGVTKVSSIIARLRAEGHDIKQVTIKNERGKNITEWFI